MTFVIGIDVFCDGKDCPVWGDDFSSTNLSKREMDRVAKTYGWKKIGKKHFCPMCVKNSVTYYEQVEKK